MKADGTCSAIFAKSSEALADIGITDALYLVSGDAYMSYRDKGQLHEHGEHKPSPAMNYIVFRKK